MKHQKKQRKEESIYQIDLKKQILLLTEATAVVLVLSYIFYRSYIAAILLSPLGVYIYKKQEKKEIKRMKWVLNLQFKDALTGIVAALSAGYSIENSISEALVDLRCIYQENDFIIKEFTLLEKKVRLNATIEEVMFEFAKRTEIEDILNFAWILHTAKRTGGDLVKIAKNTSNMISERIEVNREVKTVITEKQLESNIMNLVPIGIILYLQFGCEGFLDPLYANLAGRVIMTIVLIFYLFAFWISSKITRIEV